LQAFQLSTRVNDLEGEIKYLSGRKAELEISLQHCISRIVQIDEEVDLLTVARSLFQKASTYLRVQMSSRFADLATRALKYIFQREDIEFIVELDVKANLPTASFYVVIGEHKVDPKEALGGSMYEVIGVCLRLVCLEVFDLKGPLILDEPLRSVDSVNLQNALEFILQYCKESGRQLFIVTHNEQIARTADTLFEVTQQDGISTITEL